jgi:hypothetical protein
VGQKLAWISMVLVTKAQRRSGIGTRLLNHCIEEVRADGAVAGLDATEQGRPIYLPLGFHDLYAISRWHVDRAIDRVIDAPAGVTLRPISQGDLPRLARYDRLLSGMHRPAILEHLALRQPCRAWIALSLAGEIVGFVLGREGRAATSLGPVVADSEAIALALIGRAVASADGPFILDIPQRHRAVQAWLKRHGATTPRGYMRMTLGEPGAIADPTYLFALAGPELG